MDNENFFKLKKKDENKIVKFVKKDINKFQSLIISDYSKGFLTNSLLKKVINIFKKNNKKIYTDPKNRNIEVYKNSSFICPNQTEFYDFFDYQKLPFTKKSTIKLLKKTKANAFVVTKGSEGISVFFKKGNKMDIPQIDVNVYDVTGAGDTFAGGFSGFLSQKNDLDFETLKLAVVHGTVMASFCVEGFGTSKMQKLNKETVEKPRRKRKARVD